MCIGLYVTYPLFLLDFNKTRIFSTDFRITLKNQISQNSVQWEPNCVMWTDSRTVTTTLIAALRNFATAPKNSVPTAQ